MVRVGWASKQVGRYWGVSIDGFYPKRYAPKPKVEIQRHGKQTTSSNFVSLLDDTINIMQ